MLHGDVFVENLQKSVTNKFWNDVVTSLLTIYKTDKNTIITSLWFNHKMMEGKMRKWMDKGITIVRDILNTEDEIYSIDFIQSKLQLKCNFLLYSNIK